MKSILLITWANLKRRKVQTLLVGICISLTALMFSTLIGVYLGMEKPFDRLFSVLNASHIMMRFDINVHHPEEIINWFEEQPEVLKVSQPRIQRWMPQKLIFDGEELFRGSRLVEHQGNSKKHDQLTILQGATKDFPGPGEIWVPNHWLNNHDMVLGDSIFVPTDYGLFPLKISAIVVDAHYANGLFGGSPAWVGPGGLGLFFPLRELSSVQLGVRLNDAAVTEVVWARFNEAYRFNGMATRYDFFKSIFQVIYRFIASLLTFFAILGIIITFSITVAVVNSAIQSDYKMIGMLKSQGFTNLNVVTVYLIQFFIITLIAVPVGLLASNFMIELVFKSLIIAIGSINFDVSMFWPALVTFFTFLIGVLLITYQTARKAGNISPVTAIRFGGPPPKSFKAANYRLFSLRPSSNLPIFLGMRFLLANKKRAFFLFMGLVFVIFVQILYYNGGHSMANLSDNRSSWGLDDADLTVAGGANFTDEEDTFRTEMEEDDRIDKVVPQGFYFAHLPAQAGKAADLFVGFVYDEDPELLGLDNIEGRHPVFENEISLGVTSSIELNKTLGDTLRLFMEGQLVPFVITGIFQDINNLGRGFKIRLEGVRELNPLYKVDRYSLILEKGEDAKAFKEELIKKYGSTYDIRENEEFEEQLKSILEGLRDVMQIVAWLFLGVLFVTVFNDTVLSIRENQKNLGIFKAVGMTPKELKYALMFKSLLVSILALIIGIPVSLLLIPSGLSHLSAEVGLVEAPYVLYWSYTLMNIPLVIFITIGSVWVASKRILGIKPRVLVRE